MPLLTVCPPGRVPVLGRKEPPPLYTAVTGWLPTARLLVAMLEAVPPDKATGLPKFEPSTVNCTVPGGLPVPMTGLTVAVKVTDWPKTDGLLDEMTAVVVPVGDSVPVTLLSTEVVSAVAGMPGKIRKITVRTILAMSAHLLFFIRLTFLD